MRSLYNAPTFQSICFIARVGCLNERRLSHFGVAMLLYFFLPVSTP